MSVNDLRELSITELKNKIVDLKKELMDSRFALATSQLEDTSVFKKIRKEIAQANTVLTEKLSVENGSRHITYEPIIFHTDPFHESFVPKHSYRAH